MTDTPTRADPFPYDPIESINEVAAYARKHPKTLYRLIREGRGPDIVRLTERAIGVRRSAREAWINKHTIRNDDAAGVQPAASASSARPGGPSHQSTEQYRANRISRSKRQAR